MTGADPTEYGTHSLRRTKATLIYRQTKNLRAVQLLLGHRKIESTVRYLGVDVDDALEMAEHIECLGWPERHLRDEMPGSKNAAACRGHVP